MNHKKKKRSTLKWVYPPNNWKTNSNKTFIYGWSDSNAKLFASSDKYLIPEKIKIFPNGNFAQSIKLPDVKNKIKLIQVLNGRKKIISRNILIRTDKRQQATGNRQQTRDSSNKAKSTKQEKAKKNTVVIVIDPGHGGKEHGTHSPKGIPESKYNLQVAKLLYKELKSQNPKTNFTVYLTRTKNKFISLNNRVTFAKKKKCNLLISIHHNALPDNKNPLQHKGVGVYYLYDHLYSYAYKLLNSICKETGLCRYGVFKRDFALTRPTFCAAVLIECGFLTHPLEANYVTSKRTQVKIVQGIVNAISLLPT